MSVSDDESAVAALSQRLLPCADVLGRAMADRIAVEIPLYRDGQTVPMSELVASCTTNVRYILGRLAGQPGVDTDAPRRTGATRAEQGVSYPAVLQAFRVGSRFIWETLVEQSGPEQRDALIRAAADIWAVSDDLALQVTEVYRATLSERARRDGRLRSALLGALFEEGPVTEQLWETATTLGLSRRGEFVVVSAECPGPGEEALPAVEALLGRRNVASVWRIDHDHQEGLVALRIGYRRPELSADLARISAGRIGLSEVFGSVELARDGRREARLACHAAAWDSCEVVSYDERPLAVLLASTPDTARWFSGRVLGGALTGPHDHDALLETARVWLAENGSTAAAADRLYLHRNTVRYRLRRLEELCGLDLTKPADIAALQIALECLAIQPGRDDPGAGDHRPAA